MIPANLVRSQEFLFLEENLVVIRESINRSVEHDSLDEILREFLSEALRSPAHKISQKRTYTRSIYWLSEVKMSEEIQSKGG